MKTTEEQSERHEKLIWNLFFYESNGCYLSSPLTPTPSFSLVLWILIQLSAFSFLGFFWCNLFHLLLSSSFSISFNFYFYSFFVMSLLDQNDALWAHTHTKIFLLSFIFHSSGFHSVFLTFECQIIYLGKGIEAGIDIEYFITKWHKTFQLLSLLLPLLLLSMSKNWWYNFLSFLKYSWI